MCHILEPLEIGRIVKIRQINRLWYSIHIHNLIVVCFLQGIFCVDLPDIERKLGLDFLPMSIFWIDQNQNLRLEGLPCIQLVDNRYLPIDGFKTLKIIGKFI
mgnify:CR=1 FL=1